MSNSVKYFHSDMPNAPVLNGQPGSMIALLDACLVNGFGLVTVDAITVSGGVATASISAGHSFVPDSVALIAGAVPSALNGEKRVLTTTANTVTFDATGVGATTATGTITARLAPVGWAKPFSGTNVAAYRSADVTSTRDFLRVDDTEPLTCRVVGFESMTDVNTGVGRFPSNAQMNGGYFWDKSGSADTTPRQWTLVGDSKTFYLSTYIGLASSASANGITRVFGDFLPRRSGDPFACGLTGSLGAQDSFQQDPNHAGGGNFNGQIAAPRSYHGLGGAVLCFMGAAFQSFGTVSGSIGNALPFPNLPDNSLVFCPQLIFEGVSGTQRQFRGQSRGLLYIPQETSPWQSDHRVVLDGQGDLIGRRILVLRVNGTRQFSTQIGALGFDLTGPWG